MGYQVYGIVTAEPAFALEIENLVLTVIVDQNAGLAAIASPCDSPRLRPSRANIKLHQLVLERIMALRSAMLPMRFGMIVADDAALITQVLTPYRDQLRALLEKLDGKYEISLKVSWDQDRLFARAAEIAPTLVSAAQTTSDRIALGQKVEQVLQSIHEQTRTRILDTLSGCYVDWRLDDPGDDRTSMYAAFLVRRTDQAAFEAALDRADALFDGKLKFKMVAPLPAYSFVDLVITLDDAEGETNHDSF